MGLATTTTTSFYISKFIFLPCPYNVQADDWKFLNYLSHDEMKITEFMSVFVAPTELYVFENCMNDT